MTISVVIATCNRERLLSECLEHLARQAFEPGDEVIVVDNRSTDRTGDVIDRHARRFPVPLRHLYEGQPGKSRALARALAVARGGVLAFTDDDVNVGPSWIAQVRRAMADDAIALVGGPVAPRWERRPPRWLRLDVALGGSLAAPLAIVDYGPDIAPLGRRTAIGANLVVRRSVFDLVGGFAPHLGKLQGTLLSAEDHDLCERVYRAGLRSLYIPTLQVFHWVPATRLRLRYFVAWFFWWGISCAVLEETGERGRSLGGAPLYLYRRLASSVLGAAGAALTGRSTAAVDRLTQAAFALGYVLRRWGVVATAATRRPVPVEGHP
jgi:GT2 family glycosyltransferase